METFSPNVVTFLVNALWQVPLAAGVAGLGCHLMRRGPAWHRHALCVAALVASLALPLGGIRLGGVIGGQLELPRAAAPAADLPAAGSRPQPAPPTPGTTPRSIGFAPLASGALLLAYGFFIAWRLAQLTMAAWKTLRLRGDARPPHRRDALEAVFARCAGAFGLQGVSLLASERISGPVTAGGAVILPSSMMESDSEDVLATAIGHEMAHIARRDFAANLVYELLYLPVSFHPAAMWIHREIDRTREMACDELVTARLLEPRAYAQSIVSIAASICAQPGPGYTLGVFDGNILEQRIRRLMEGRRGGLQRARATLLAGLAGLAICAVVASSLRVTAWAQGPASAELKAAAAAYDASDFQGAVNHFRAALAQEPNNLNIRLHLANAEIEMFRRQPHGIQEAKGFLAEVRQQYLEVLARDNANTQALESLAALDARLDSFQEARALAERLLKADPRNKSGYYLVGWLDWNEAYKAIDQARRAESGPTHAAQLANAAARRDLRDRYLPVIDEGLKMMHTAIQLDPTYADAMAYENLLLRAKAAIVDDPAEVRNLTAEADQWVQKALDATRARRSLKSAAPTATHLDVNAPPQELPDLAPPPPPPPPPPPRYRKGEPAKPPAGK